MDFNGDVSSLDADLLKLHEVSPLALKPNPYLAQELFEQWLSLPETNCLLLRVGINPEFITFSHVTMESNKYICVRETSPQNSVVIIDMSMPSQPLSPSSLILL
ncbi:hypothetical protein BVRB_1g013010 [Beta vulgaris subsp. vulgaris]|nr:hypothetical protein BVRB_1g013010 [Beta vulgaris subsp. vulgaris]